MKVLSVLDFTKILTFVAVEEPVIILTLSLNEPTASLTLIVFCVKKILGISLSIMLMVLVDCKPIMPFTGFDNLIATSSLGSLRISSNIFTVMVSTASP